MGYTIYEINPANLPSNVSITMTPQLEELVQEQTYEAPVRKKPSVAQRISAFALAALMALIPIYASCGGNGPNGNGDAINPIPSGYSVSNNITPADGASVGAGDDPLEVGVDTPAVAAECSADADCAAEAASGLDVVIEVIYDNGTPGNPGDDEIFTVASHTGVPFGTYTSGTLDMSAAHSGAGLADDEGIEAHVSLTFTDSKGERHTIEGSARYTFNDDTPVGPQILDDWDLIAHRYGEAFSIRFNLANTGDNMEYYITEVTPAWFATYLADPRIRGPADFETLDIAGTAVMSDWSRASITAHACNLDTGLCGERTAEFELGRYGATMTVQNPYRTCNTTVTNAYADYVGIELPGYITTDHVDGSAVRTSEATSAANPAELNNAVGKIESTTAQQEEDISHISDPDGTGSFSCVTTALSEGEIEMIQIDIYE